MMLNGLLTIGFIGFFAPKGEFRIFLVLATPKTISLAWFNLS